MKRLTSFQINYLVRSFTLFFFATTALWAAGNYIAIRDVLVSWPVFVVNLTLSVALSWWYYRYRYHIVFSYDDTEFDLHVGQRRMHRRWSEFDAVSLVHKGNRNFVVRLYDGHGELPVDIPATALKLDPQQFRFQVLGFTRRTAIGTGS